MGVRAQTLLQTKPRGEPHIPLPGKDGVKFKLLILMGIQISCLRGLAVDALAREFVVYISRLSSKAERELSELHI